MQKALTKSKVQSFNEERTQDSNVIIIRRLNRSWRFRRTAPRSTSRSMVPAEAILVSESGLNNAADVRRLHDVGYSAFLIGETLMRSAHPERTLKSFRELARV